MQLLFLQFFHRHPLQDERAKWTQLSYNLALGENSLPQRVRGRNPATERILVYFGHINLHPFDCLMTNNFPCLLPIKRKFP